MIEYILSPQSVEALGWTLLHSLWQGAVFAILLVLLLIVLRSYTAQSRYVVAVGLLFAFFLSVSATFWQQWQQANMRLDLTDSPFNKQLREDVFVLNNSTEKVGESDKADENIIQNKNEILAKDQSSWLLSFRAYFDYHLPLIVTLWLLGIFFLQLRFLGQLAYVQRLKHYGTQLFPPAWSDKIEELEGKLRIQKKVNYLTSLRVESPMVIGWLKPVVLLPRQLLNNLSESEIYAILAHELAHIRREDFIVNLIQTFLCNVFFFHPGIWWMSNRIDDEREHCCDDLAVAATGSAASYAKTLINVSEFQLKMQEGTPLAMALSGKGKTRSRGGFSARIRRLFMVGNRAGSFREGFATSCILIAALFIGVVATGRSVSNSETTNPVGISHTEKAKQPVPTTETTRPLETNKTAIISEKEKHNSIKPKQNTVTITTRIEAKDQLISRVDPISNFRKLPIAAPEKPEPPQQPEPPVNPGTTIRFDETRIDALVMACEEGDLDFVKTLINSGIDINGIGSEGFTPLMMASSNDEAEIVDYLLKQGADVNQTFNGWTALMEAADEGALASMKHLLSAGADVNYYGTAYSPTAISMAASEGKLACLKLLLAHGADINGIGKSIPPLHIAAEEDKRNIIEYLISQKVDLDKKDAGGHTALMYAAAEGQEYTVVLLVEAGADKSIIDANGYTASDYAEEEKEYDTRDYLEGKTTNIHGTDVPASETDSDTRGERPAIHQATLDGLIEKVQRMVAQGTDVNTRDDYGRTPLHISAAENHNIDMQVLIDLGADINAQDNQGRTPMMYAAAAGKGEAVALLVSKVADVNIQDVDGMRAYEWAQSGGNSDLAKFLGLITENKNKSNYKEKKKRLKEQEKRIQDLVEKEVQKELKAFQKEKEKKELFHVAADGYHLRQFDIDKQNSALLEAARNGTVKDCQNLLNNGLSANAADDTGQTALMVAAMKNRLDIAKFLIEQGADVNQQSTSGLTALHYTALENHTDMARLLLKNNAKVDPTMQYSSTDGNYGQEPIVWQYIGATPLLIATESGNAEVLSILIDAGANPNHTLSKMEYRLNKNRTSYLSGSEVMGLDGDFLKDVDVKISDHTWTPYKQALLLNEPEILALY